MDLIDTYNRVVNVEYRGEKYSVRDNGSVLRHPKNPDKKRKYDDIWMFGTNIDEQKHYYLFANEAVHRIVATAFLGEPKDKSYVVDHIDTNHLNNRPENLRWVTRLENILLNDITRHKIEYICGCSVEDVLKDMTILRSKSLAPNFEWMKTVSDEEAKVSLERWRTWCKETEGRRLVENEQERIFKNFHTSRDNGNYPYEPKDLNASLEDYSKSLSVGNVFFSKEYFGNISHYIIQDFYYDQKNKILYVATSSAAGIKSSFYTEVRRQHDEFVYSTRSCFDPKSVEKYMTVARGEEWTGGDVIDDYC